MHLVFVINHVAFFVSHRLPIAIAARQKGWEVTLLTGMPGSESMEQAALHELAEHGILHQRFPYGSAGINPLVELKGMLQLAWALRRLSPDLVHCASPKGVIYGGIASRIARVPSLVLAISGLGFTFTTGRRGAMRKALASIVSGLARLACGHSNLKVIVQNADDRIWVKSLKVADEDTLLIRGSGVDLYKFRPDPRIQRLKQVVFPARLLRDKGVVEFVEAVRAIRDRACGWKFVLAGAADYQNPSRISPKDVTHWVQDGLVEWRGHVENMSALLAETSIVVLPSYREGFPKSLIDAAAAGCAIITTDTTGCRDAILDGVTGVLVPVRNVSMLANAMMELIGDPQKVASFGRAGRSHAVLNFGQDSVLDGVFGAYDSLNRRARQSKR